jgi:hypothetical protein
METGARDCQPSGVAEAVILLEGGVSMTPELHAWISQRLGSGRAALTRTRLADSDRAAVLLRVEVDGSTEAAMQEEVADLVTDLRLLGLRPTLLSEQPV